MSDTPQQEQQPVVCCGGGAPPPASSRRDFLLLLGLGMNGLAALLVSIPIIGYIFTSFVQKMPLKWINLGKITDFPDGTTRLATYTNPYRRPWDGETAEIPCWVRHETENKFQIFAINCTHLGCPVRWFEESNLFMCPCHGGAFYQDGSHAAGPPPRGLYQYKYKVENGNLWVEGGVIPSLANAV
ncbi:MAG: Rieske 2Fe-2S domain-containing protein [Chthoniobacterales bacterium]